MLIYKTTRVSDTSIDLLHVQKDHLIVVDSARDLGYHKWRTLDPEIDPPFLLQLSKRGEKNISGYSMSEMQSKQRVNIFSTRYGISKFVVGVLFSCGHFDGTAKAISMSSGHVLQSVKHPYGKVKCLTVCEKYLVTGSFDCSIAIWRLNSNQSETIIQSTPLHILVGHDGPITSVFAQPSLNTLLSASEDGSCIIYDFHSGDYGKSIVAKQGSIIEWAGLSLNGSIVTYQDDSLSLYTINGKQIDSTQILEDDVLSSILFNETGNYLITGGMQGRVYVYSLYPSSLLIGFLS